MTPAQEALFKSHSHLSYPNDEDYDEEEKYIFIAYREDDLLKSFIDLRNLYRSLKEEDFVEGKIELLNEMITFLNHEIS